MKITEFKLTELKAACKSAGAKGYSALSKSELLEWIAASPRSADILAALPLPGETSAPAPGEEVEGQFYQFGPGGQIHEGQDLETFLSETSLQDFFPGCVVEVEEDAIAAPPSECMDEKSSIEEKAIATPEEGTDPDAGAKFKLIESILSLSSQLGCEGEGVAQKITGKSLTFCSVKELNLVFGRLTRLSQLVGKDDSEPIPEDELSEDEKAANAFGAQFVADFLEGGEGAIVPVPDCEEMAAALNQIFSEDLNIYVAVIRNDVLSVVFWDTEENFLIVCDKALEQPWYLEEPDEEYEGWSLRFNICNEALTQAYTVITCEGLEETEAEKQQAIDAINLDLALATDGDRIPSPECMDEKLQPPPQHLRDRSQAIFEVDTPNGSSFVPSNGTTGDIWESIWCEQCIHFTDSGCRIYVEALAGESPEEWQYWDNKPLCTGFEEGIPPEEPIAPPPPPEASTACPIFYPGDIVRRFIEPYIVVGPDKERPGNWLVRSQEFPEAGEYSLCLLWPHLSTPSKSYKFPECPRSLFSLWNLATENSHKIRLMDGWDNRDIAARLQNAGFQFANRIWDFCEFESYEKLFAEFVTCGDWVIGRSGPAIVACWDPHLFIWQIESQDLDYWVSQIESWQSEWRDPVIVKSKTLLKATA
ncbi:hypothetical protein [Laspinema palackyanum]|uniref:hypothetical protein n=1 Tax=Laspinema palackyanum TaxID=3231601 RepID=UPI00345D42FC|nr:hypothetical protein [Laspinema sp. D2c]